MRGDVFHAALPLPGTADTGLRHHAFSVASPEYIAANAATILISSTTGSRYQVRLPFGLFLVDAQLYQHEQGRNFDITRPVTPTLLGVVPLAKLGRRIGTVGAGFFTGVGCQNNYGANDALRVQLQLPGRMEALAKIYRQPRDVAHAPAEGPSPTDRLSIWSEPASPRLWLLVSNDKNNRTTGIVTGLELVDAPAAFPSTTLSSTDQTLGRQVCLGSILRQFRLQRPGSTGPKPGFLGARVGEVTAGGQPKVDAHLEAMLGLTD